MEFFIDTANLDEIKEAISWGIVKGCTTNPKIVSKEKGVDYEKHMKDVLKIVPGPVSIEVTTNEKAEEMAKEAIEYSKWAPNVVIKLPMNKVGMKALKMLNEKNIKTNVTACMSMNQALMAAQGGATYASLFFGRINDMGYDAYYVVKDTADLFENQDIKTKIIVGSIRHIMDINRATMAGAHVITIPFQFLEKMVWNPQTDRTIDEFLRFWAEFKKTQKK